MLATSAARCLRCSSSKRSTEGHSPRRLLAPFAELEGRCMADRVSMCTPRLSVRKGRACEGACQSNGCGSGSARWVYSAAGAMPERIHPKSPMHPESALPSYHTLLHARCCHLLSRVSCVRRECRDRATAQTGVPTPRADRQEHLRMFRLTGLSAKSRTCLPLFAPRKSCARSWRVSTPLARDASTEQPQHGPSAACRPRLALWVHPGCRLHHGHSKQPGLPRRQGSRDACPTPPERTKVSSEEPGSAAGAANDGAHLAARRRCGLSRRVQAARAGRLWLSWPLAPADRQH